jgi:ribosomal protein S18 acetylase RimI-like enzyme
MTVRIRPGTEADAAPLAALAALTFPLATPSDTRPEAIDDFVATTLSAARFVEYLTHPSRVVLVAEIADEPVGYAMLNVGEPDDPEVLAAVTTRPTVDLNKFYVHPGHHGSGIATTLMAAIVGAARDTGARSVWLGVNNENERANRFYEKHGFAVVGTKHFRLGDRLEDDYVRELLL